jgi:hypothetical protein
MRFIYVGDINVAYGNVMAIGYQQELGSDQITYVVTYKNIEDRYVKATSRGLLIEKLARGQYKQITNDGSHKISVQAMRALLADMQADKCKTHPKWARFILQSYLEYYI